MRRTLIIALMLTLLIITACNRFDNTFEPDTSFSDRLDIFNIQLTNSLEMGDIDQILTFYDEGYLYDGKTKADVRAFYTSIADEDPDSVFVDISSLNRAALTFTYRLIAYKSPSNLRVQDVVIDTTIVEYTLGKEDDYLIRGNQREEDIEVSSDRRVLVELFTARFCPNCPYVEQALYDLKQVHGDKFFYIEYHTQAPFNFGNQDIAAYYGVISQPTGIIQGTSIIRGGSETESYSQYNNVISRYFDIEADFDFTGFSSQSDGDNVSFSLQVIAKDKPLPQNLKFKYALIEKVSDQNNLQGQPFRNVTVAKGDIDLTEDRFNNTDGDIKTADINIEFERPDFDFNTPAIVVWIQVQDPIYDDETSEVHNAAEYQITLSD